jgi:hypothetical protein
MASSSSTNKDNSQLDLPALYANSSQAQVRMPHPLAAAETCQQCPGDSSVWLHGPAAGT